MPDHNKCFDAHNCPLTDDVARMKRDVATLKKNVCGEDDHGNQINSDCLTRRVNQLWNVQKAQIWILLMVLTGVLVGLGERGANALHIGDITQRQNQSDQRQNHTEHAVHQLQNEANTGEK